MLITALTLLGVAICLYAAYRVYRKQEAEIEDKGSDLASSQTESKTDNMYSSHHMEYEMMVEQLKYRVEPNQDIAKMYGSEWGDGYGIYTEENMTGCIPFIRAGYADDPEALTWCKLLGRKIAYIYDSGHIETFNNIKEVYEFETAARNGERTLLEFDPMERELVEDLSKRFLGKRVEELNEKEFELLVERIRKERRELEREQRPTMVGQSI